MAITPASLDSLSGRELALVAQAEGFIDADLRDKWTNSLDTVRVRNSILRSTLKENRRVLDAVIVLYQAAGWDVVEYVSKDGIYLSFSAS